MDKKSILVSVGISLLGAVLLILVLRTPPVSTVIEKVTKEIGAFPGGDIYVPVTFRTDAVVGEPYVATTTPAALTGHTLAQAFLNSGNYFVVTVGGADETNYTYTFPASTSLRALVPDIGQSIKKCFFVTASSTSAHELVFAAGTGVDFIHASTTVALQTISVPSEVTACLTFQRQPAANLTAGDISVWLDLGVNSD